MPTSPFRWLSASTAWDLVHRAAGAREKLHLSGTKPPTSRDDELPTAKPARRLQAVARDRPAAAMGVVYEATQLSLGAGGVAVQGAAAGGDIRRQAPAAVPQRGAGGGRRLHHTNIVPVYAVGLRARASISTRCSSSRASRWPPSSRNCATDSGNNAGRDVLPVGGRRRWASQPRGDDAARNAKAEHAATRGVDLVDGALAQAARFSFAARARLIKAGGRGRWSTRNQFGIVHRDIKPAKPARRCTGPAMGDRFRPSAQFHTEAGLTQTGDMLGTLRYMSPEQASGQRGPDGRPAPTIYLAGRHAVRAGDARTDLPRANSHHAILQQIVHKEPRAAAQPSMRTSPSSWRRSSSRRSPRIPFERYATAKRKTGRRPGSLPRRQADPGEAAEPGGGGTRKMVPAASVGCWCRGMAAGVPARGGARFVSLWFIQGAKGEKPTRLTRAEGGKRARGGPGAFSPGPAGGETR